MVTIVCRWVVVVLLSVYGGVVVAQGAGFSRVSVPVENRSREAFSRAVTQGYAEVMAKLSGNPSIMTTPAVQNSVGQAGHCLLRYNYTVREGQLELQMTFNERALANVLQKTGQGILGKERPQTLVILRVPQGNVFELVSSDSAGNAAALLKQLATRHGLPILLPMADLEDQTLFSNDSTASLSPVERESLVRRYQVSHLLYGVVNQGGDRLSVNWQLWFGDRFNQWVSSGKSLPEVIDYGFDRLLEAVANQYAVVRAPSLRRDVLLKISGIRRLADYVRVVRAVKKLAPVNTVSVKEMTIDSLLLQVNVSGGEEALQRSLQSDTSPLQGLSSSSERDNAGAALNYQWQGWMQND